MVFPASGELLGVINVGKGHPSHGRRGTRIETAYCLFPPSAFPVTNQGNEGPQGPREKKGDKGGFGSTGRIGITSGEVSNSISNGNAERNYSD